MIIIKLNNLLEELIFMLNNTLILQEYNYDSNTTGFPEWFTSDLENLQRGNQAGELGEVEIAMVVLFCAFITSLVIIGCCITPLSCEHLKCLPTDGTGEKELLRAKDHSHHVHLSINDVEKWIVIAGGEDTKLMD